MARYKELEAPAYLLGKYANYDMALRCNDTCDEENLHYFRK